MKPEIEQELSHILLVELLAYQFASPVRWIETQDVILADKVAERIVEIGPSDTLGGMARRTLAAKYEAYDSALSLQRQILCYNKDLREIYYDVDPSMEEEAQAEAPVTAVPTESTQTPASAIAIAAQPSQGPVAAIADAPVSASEILQAVIAQKLKKPIADISMQKAIKDLVGGKSTLQNEIIGDLGKEFGSLSEKPEDLPLEELASASQASFDGQLGKHSHSLIARLMSSKMPGGFTVTTARKYLQDRWGLQNGRQDGVLLLALTMEPEARLAKEQDAKSFWDRVAAEYGTRQGITYSSGGGSTGSSNNAAVAIDPAILENLSKGQSSLFKQQLELLARYLKLDLKAGDRALSLSQTFSNQLQAQLDLWLSEHGEFYASGIQPIFSPLKCRVYDSNWNWARQDALTMYFDIIFGRLKLVDREIVAQCIRVMNRSNSALMEFMQYRINNCPKDKGETYELARDLGRRLIDNCREVLQSPPVFKDVSFPTAPQTVISPQGELSYAEVPRPAVRKLEQYVKEMAAGGSSQENSSRSQAQHDLQKIYRLIRQQRRLSRSSQFQIKSLYSNILRNLTPDGDGFTSTNAVSNKRTHIQKNRRLPKLRNETVPFLHLKRKEDSGWEYSKKLTSLYLEGLETAARDGLSFAGKHVLMTGAGAGSIGSDILQGLLSGGAKVVVTTSRFSKEATDYYQEIYSRYGGKGSQLIVVPFNQGSKQDITALVDYIYDQKSGLGWDLDTIVPFAAIPTNGREIDNIDSNCELGHRIMLTNLLRLLGAIKTQKFERGIETRPAQVILPLSPNHGTFGGDGLYSESKLGLETLFNRWGSESWGNYLTICGAVIGWTRGTGLMSGNNSIAEGIEAYGVRTFSQQEMAFNILGLMAPSVVNLCQVEPVFADLNGGLQNLPNYQEISSRLRQELKETAEIRRALYLENVIDNRVVNGHLPDKAAIETKVQRRANLKFEFPSLPDFSDYNDLHKTLSGMVDLERVVVVTGFAEVGPWGNARTRWEMEASGQFSLEGCIEMAWIMGLIKNHNGPIKGKMYSGWVDSKSGEPVEDKDVKSRYEAQILQHSGIRLIEPDLFDGYNPEKKQLLQEVILEEDLPEFEASQEAAEEFKRYHGDNVEITEIAETGQYSIQLRKGAVLLIPKALKFDRLVAGQIPTGWDARRYGIPEDIISQVDPVTLYVLVCVAESMLSAGITDPYEFYKYVHVSQVGNCVGSGVGGMTALRGMYKDRWMDKPIQKDILQESFINTMSAWVNMLLLSSSGPIKTPVGACATAVESLDIGYETIVEGKARVCFVGGFDDFAEEGSYEFANMKATSNAEEEFARGRTPRDMSRPTTSTRSGFMESQGCGVQLLMDAKLALDMGVPIYGILAMTATATDKIGRSVPAPGQGILTTAREAPSQYPSPLLDISYRRRQLNARKAQIKEWLGSEMQVLESDLKLSCAQNGVDGDYIQMRIDHINKEALRQEKEAMNTWGNSFYRNDPHISPLRGALAVWGLTVDDIDVASFHGTSTKANDKNESDAVQKMLSHLNRSKGNALLGIFQKYLTGHPKGAAGAWMFNGVLQVLNSGLVPGNRNADNIDQELETFNHILYPSRSIQTDGIKAASVTSFGFGQKGAQAIALHPKYLFATLDEEAYNEYRSKVAQRYKKAYRYAHDSMVNNTLFQAKDTAPYTKDLESEVLLNPLARVKNSRSDGLQFEREPVKQSMEALKSAALLSKMTAEAASGETHVGIDVEDIQAINIDNETFVSRNFSDIEKKYCYGSPCPQASFAGKWCAKEAVFKSFRTASQGGGASMIDIEILNDKYGAPYVKLHGNAAKIASESNISSIKISISHSDKQAMAVALSS